MVSRLVVIVHVLKVQNAPRPVRFSRVNTHLGASSCHQHGECVPPRRLELRRRPVVQVHITILVVRESAYLYPDGDDPDSSNSDLCISLFQAMYEVYTASDDVPSTLRSRLHLLQLQAVSSLLI